MAETVVEEYRSSLSDLTFNSKPLISMLTMLAEDNEQYAADIVQVIEAHIQKAKSSEKLPVLYLIDSIIKNMPKSCYLTMFLTNLVNIFGGVFEKVDEKTRGSMYKLRQTWTEIMPNNKLYALDTRIQKIDPAWPVTAKPEEPTVASIHVNPKFLMKQQDDMAKEQEDQEALMRQQLLAKQQELLKLQQERLELELAEAKARLDTQTKQFETQTPEAAGRVTTNSKQQVVPPPPVPVAQSTGSPVPIPTVAVPGIIRDPRVTRDPRLSRTAGPAKEDTPPPRSAATSGQVSLPSTSSSPAPPSSLPLPRSSSSRSEDKPRGKDEKDPRSSSSRSKGPSSSSSSSASRKPCSPPRGKDDKKDDPRKRGAADSRSKSGRSDRGSSSSSSVSTRSGHRSYKHNGRSRSTSPERKSGSRSRSRSPRRSPRSSEKRDRGHTWDQKEGGSEGKRRKSPEKANAPIQIIDDPILEGVSGASSEEGAPPAKKSKSDVGNGESASLPPDFRELFGSKDQDYRRPPTNPSAFPQTPQTPDTPSTGRWAQFKATRPEEFPFAQPRAMMDLPSPVGRPQDVDMRGLTMRRLSSSSDTLMNTPISPEQLNIDIPAPLMLEKLDTVLSEADAQLRSGRLTHEQHQSLLRQLGELQKLQKVKQELRSVREAGLEHITPPTTSQEEPRLSPHGPGGMVVPTDTDARMAPVDRPRPGFVGPLERGVTDRTGGGPADPRAPPHDPRAPPMRGARSKPMDPRRSSMRGLPPPPAPPPGLTGHPHPAYGQDGPRGRGLPPMPRPPLPPHLAGRGGRRYERGTPQLYGGKFDLPYDTEKYYIPEHDPRWVAHSNEEPCHKFYLSHTTYELPLGCRPRLVRIGADEVELSVDCHTRGIKLGGICYYRIGDPVKEVTFNNRSYSIHYQGPARKIWIDDLAFEVHIDGPPQPIHIGGNKHTIQIDSIMNQVLIDERVVCPFGGPKKQIEIGYNKHEVQFEPPPRKILIDGTLCEMNFKGKYPCVNMKGIDYGIRFDGPPRVITINDKPWTVPMDTPRKCRVYGERQHILAFGGPGHEVIVNGQWYELKFNGPEKPVTLGTKVVKIKLQGPPPEVKILGEVVKDPVKIQELVGNAYIDPSMGIVASPRYLSETEEGFNNRYTEYPRGPVRRGRPDRGYHHRHEGGRGFPPRGLPAHMEDRGRGSPRYDEGRNSPNMDHHRNSPKDPIDVPSLLHMDIEPPPRPLPPPQGDVPPPIGELPPPRDDGPPIRHEGPPVRHDGPPVRHDGPPIRHDGPPIRHEGPPIRHEGPPIRHDGPPIRHEGPPSRYDGPRRDDWYDRPPGSMRDHPMHDVHRDGPMRDRPMRHEGPRLPYGPLPHRGYRGLGPRFRGQRPQMPPHPMGYPDDGYYQPHGPGPRPDMRRPDGPLGYGQFAQPPPEAQNPAGGMDLSALLTSQIDVNSLFSKLVQSGIIKKKDEAPGDATQPKDSAANAPAPAADSQAKPGNQPAEQKKAEGEKENEPPAPVIPVIREKLSDIPDMTSFNVDKMKKKHPGVIQRMYGGIQCSSCGVRFLTDDMDRYREHLDWHFRQNKRDKDGVKMAKFRSWYYTTNEWIQFEEIGDLEERSHSVYFERLLQSHPAIAGSSQQTMDAPISCPAATGEAGDDTCEMCGEQFENFFDEDTEEWRLRDAVRYGGKTYHPACYEDVQETSLLETPTPEADDPSDSDTTANPLAFLSRLAAPGVKEEVQDPTSETTADDKPAIKAEPIEVKPEPQALDNESEDPTKTVIKHEEMTTC